MNKLNVVSYGGGVNSTAMLIEAVSRGIQIDLILFADTGGEKPHTYYYIKLFSKWLVKNKMPKIITITKGGIQETLEENCLRCNMLPSLAYGFKSCSHKYKIQPQNKYCNNWLPAKELWKEGSKVTKFIGYDADEHHRAKIPEDKKYVYKYPLVEWDIGRDDCIQIIKDAGLPPCGKSACFFCPASRESEVRQLKEIYPELAERAIAMERNANLKIIKGLGRRYSWEDLLSQEELFDKEHIDNSLEIACGCYDG